jgi:hypothetical protein
MVCFDPKRPLEEGSYRVSNVNWKNVSIVCLLIPFFQAAPYKAGPAKKKSKNIHGGAVVPPGSVAAPCAASVELGVPPVVLDAPLPPDTSITAAAVDAVELGVPPGAVELGVPPDAVELGVPPVAAVAAAHVATPAAAPAPAPVASPGAAPAVAAPASSASTPQRRSKASASVSVASTPSRQSTRNGKVDNSVCNHCDVAGFVTYGLGEHLGYFKEPWLSKQLYFPKECASCSKKFCSKKKEDCASDEWSARDFKVRLCSIGANTTRHDCVYALCDECAGLKGVHTPDKRARKPKKRIG